MKRRQDRPRHVADDLDRALRDLGAESDAVPLAVLLAWPAAVGPQAARRSQPVRLVRGRLVVHATSEVWVSELTSDSSAILARLEKAAGRPLARAVQFVVGDVLVPAEAAAPPESSPPVDVPAEVEEILKAVEDPALRESMRRAVGLSLGRNR